MKYSLISAFTTHDMFCGCGGSSQGVLKAVKKHRENMEDSLAKGVKNKRKLRF